MSAYAYPIALLAISALVMALERIRPWRKGQRQLRRTLGSDLLHLIFNGHFLGVILYGLSERYVLPSLSALAQRAGIDSIVPVAIAGAWPLWIQIPVVIVVFDFIQWCIHNLLHRVPAFWEFHKVHHSVVDGEMDFIVSFRFHFGEVVVYKSLQYLPLLFFGFSSDAIFAHAVVGTLIGHLNHSNLDLGHGVWRYIVNSPRMHIWHHDYEAAVNGTTRNFGIIFSAWDWIFGTATLPDHPPPRLGFEGVDRFPRQFFAQEAWPIANKGGAVASATGLALIAAGWVAQTPPAFLASESDKTPTNVASAAGVASADDAFVDFGESAALAGFAHPEEMVAASELSRALSAPSLVVLDVRPKDRFEQGHIPGARAIARDDYEVQAPIYGLSKSADDLEALLRARGVKKGSVVVLYGDGNAEPYRLWWTLREVAGFRTRVLDGGLQAWKKLGLAVAGGESPAPAQGDVHLNKKKARLTWSELAPAKDAVMLDTRSLDEYTGKKKHEKTAQAGHIPGAVHLEWTQVMDESNDHRLKTPDELRAVFEHVGVGQGSRVVTSCTTGTRSSVTYFALLQLGMREDQIANYNGSWSEYATLGLPIAKDQAEQK